MTKLEQMENAIGDIIDITLKFANTLPSNKLADRFYVMLISELLATIGEYDIIKQLDKKYKVVRHGW